MAAALPIAVAANTRRTESAAPRLLARYDAADSIASVNLASTDPATTEQFLAAVDALPDVRSHTRYGGTFISLIADDGTIDPRLQLGSAIGKVLGQTDTDDLDSFRILEGRLPDLARADEVMVDHELLAITGWHVGDTVDALRLYRISDQDETLEPIPEKGTQISVHIVAEVSRPEDYLAPAADRLPHMYFDAAWNAMYPDAATYVNEYIRLNDSSQIGAFHQRVSAIWAGYSDNQLIFANELDGLHATQDSLRPQTVASWLMVAVLCIAALLIAAQAIGRRILADNRDLADLHALGLTRSGLWQLGAAQGATISGGAAVVAVVLGFFSSALTPIGASHDLDPTLGLRFDFPVLAIGLTASLVLLTLASMVPAWRLARTASSFSIQQREFGRHDHPSRVVSALAKVGVGPAALTGSRFALQPGRGRSATPVRGVLISAGFALGVLTAVVAFNADLDHLIATPRLHGWDWDVAVVNKFGSIPDGAVDLLRDQPEVADLSAMTVGSLTIDGSVVPSVGIDMKDGAVFPTLVDGRAPVTDGEIVLGKLTLDDTGKSIGDQIDVGTDAGARRLTIVGVATFPSIGSARFSETSLGRGAAVVVDNLPAPQDDEQGRYAGVFMRLDPSLDRSAAIASLRGFLAEQGCTDADCLVTDQRPRTLKGYTTFDDVAIPFFVGLELLFAISLAHGAVSTIGLRRRELWILSAIGFERRQIDAVVLWETLTAAIVSLVAGVITGLIGAQIGWRVFTGRLGIVTATSSPILRLLLVCLATIAIAAVIGALAIPSTRRRTSRRSFEANASL